MIDVKAMLLINNNYTIPISIIITLSINFAHPAPNPGALIDSTGESVHPPIKTNPCKSQRLGCINSLLRDE